nr:unnamed protein product [Callosobruchus chinensis]
MSRNNFETLLEMVRPTIEKSDTRFREAIPAEVRLAITLRFLATGDSFASLTYLFRVLVAGLSSHIESFVCLGVTESAINNNCR